MLTGRKGENFGQYVREQREAKGIGLREMAKMIGVSPTYLSKIERGEFDPPAEDKVKRIAEIIFRDPDELLALAGRVPTDLVNIILRRPREMADLLRAAKGLAPEHVTRFTRRLAQDAEKRTPVVIESPIVPAVNFPLRARQNAKEPSEVFGPQLKKPKVK
jgi:transcriptional regulator with XRE-family HTH domain